MKRNLFLPHKDIKRTVEEDVESGKELPTGCVTPLNGEGAVRVRHVLYEVHSRWTNRAPFNGRQTAADTEKITAAAELVKVCKMAYPAKDFFHR